MLTQHANNFLLVFILRVLVFFGRLRLQAKMGMTNATNGTLYVGLGAATKAANSNSNSSNNSIVDNESGVVGGEGEGGKGSGNGSGK